MLDPLPRSSAAGTSSCSSRRVEAPSRRAEILPRLQNCKPSKPGNVLTMLGPSRVQNTAGMTRVPHCSPLTFLASDRSRDLWLL